ncbi:P2Y purinoceptor 14 isoform X1 [Hypomesus transpacificus]|uniref:P2Y purinoceptor 14 isoform X1 n=1 Tax=Hypomesus transpacificus TaxID=137520 RepID=UPI001F077CE4|nr:P2Y purinoceptor 14 isoform X1 [Hypomesus transpacificus]
MEHVNSSSPVNSTLGNDSCCDIQDVPQTFFITTYGLVFLLGLVLNGITVRVYFCQAQRRPSSVTVYLKNLVVADFLLSLCIPLRIANYASRSVMRRVYCSFGASAFYLNMYASILFMDYIAANRYLKIVRPLENHSFQTVRSAHLVSIATWSVLVTMMCIYVTLHLVTSQDETQPCMALGCDTTHSPEMHLFYKIIHSSLAAIFLFVLVSLVLLYRGTCWRLEQAQRARRTACRKLSRSRSNMRVLVGVFCVCFVPYHLVRVPYALFKRRCEWARLFYFLKEGTVLLSVLNACLDPFIYFIFSKAFREQLGVGGASNVTQTQLEMRGASNVTQTQLEMRRASNVTQTQLEMRRNSEGLLGLQRTEKTIVTTSRRTSVI